MGLTGMLRFGPSSVLPVRLRAWRMVSIFKSLGAVRLWWPLPGLPMGFLEGLISMPLMLPGLLVGGLVPSP